MAWSQNKTKTFCSFDVIMPIRWVLGYWCGSLDARFSIEKWYKLVARLICGQLLIRIIINCSVLPLQNNAANKCKFVHWIASTWDRKTCFSFQRDLNGISHMKIHLIQSKPDIITVFVSTDSLNMAFQHIEHTYSRHCWQLTTRKQHHQTKAYSNTQKWNSGGTEAS